MPLLTDGLVVIIIIATGAFAQDYDFSDTIHCYKCIGSAKNSTCAQPGNSLDSIFQKTQCRRGGCVKWTHYVDGKLILERTCTERMKMNLWMMEACRYEGSGNGYFCMCSNDFCNSSPKATDSGFPLYLTTIAFLSIARSLTSW